MHRDWLVSHVHWSHADSPSRKGLVSPLGNCRWSFFLTSLFVTVSTKFGHSLAHPQNRRRQTQFCRDVFCPDQLCISSLLESSQLLSTQETKSTFLNLSLKYLNVTEPSILDFKIVYGCLKEPENPDCPLWAGFCSCILSLIRRLAPMLL